MKCVLILAISFSALIVTLNAAALDVVKPVQEQATAEQLDPAAIEDGN